MTDALWNGIIGAGGAAIYCAVYYSFKGIRKISHRIRIDANKNIEKDSNNLASEQLEVNNKNNKPITRYLPTKEQIFTRRNIKSFLWICLSIATLLSVEFNLVNPYHNGSIGLYDTFEGDYYTDVVHNLYYISYNTKHLLELPFLLKQFAENILYIISGGLFIVGITGFSFKKN